MLVTSYPSWWQMLAVLSVAVVLSTAVGMERQLRQKTAGMRTHTHVGLGAALFLIVPPRWPGVPASSSTVAECPASLADLSGSQWVRTDSVHTIVLLSALAHTLLNRTACGTGHTSGNSSTSHRDNRRHLPANPALGQAAPSTTTPGGLISVMTERTTGPEVSLSSRPVRQVRCHHRRRTPEC